VCCDFSREAQFNQPKVYIGCDTAEVQRGSLDPAAQPSPLRATMEYEEDMVFFLSHPQFTIRNRKSMGTK